jgi:two-component system cell cycle sensor histidine kinase/response regulator CckA
MTPRPTAPNEPESGPRALPWLKSGEVLIADDDGPIRTVLRRALERFGLKVVEVEDGDDAVATIAEDPARFRLIVLDLTMPRLNGDDALMRIRSVAPELPALVLSGFLEDEIRQRVNGSANVGMLNKPFTTRRLADALWELLGPGDD